MLISFSPYLAAGGICLDGGYVRDGRGSGWLVGELGRPGFDIETHQFAGPKNIVADQFLHFVFGGARRDVDRGGKGINLEKIPLMPVWRRGRSIVACAAQIVLSLHRPRGELLTGLKRPGQLTGLG